MAIILGSDVGARNWGYCIADISETKKEILKKGHWYIKENEIQDRLVFLEINLSSLIEKYKVEYIALEAPYMRNSKVAMDLYMATAIPIYLAGKNKLPLFRYSAAEVKLSAAKTGKAEKIHVQEAVKTFFSITDKFKDSHSSDACAVCITCFNKHLSN